MEEVTRIIGAIEGGDPEAASRLLPLIYDELRALAARRIAAEKPGHMLQATALVHEAYLRLVGGQAPREWNGRGHFFAAAAEAMRRILVEDARNRNRRKRGGGAPLEELDPARIAAPEVADDLIELDSALDRLAAEDPESAQLVKLRYFAGLTIPEAAQVLNISPRKADSLWSFARAWLKRRMTGD